MLTPIVDRVSQAAEPTGPLLWLPMREIAVSLLQTLLFLGVVVAVGAVLEWRAKADVTRYRSRGFLNDLAYALFYRGGFHRVLLFSVVTGLLDARFGFMKLGLLTDAPLAVRIVVFWVAGDFVLYWAHRWQHRSRFLWAFHSVHHSQEHLTTLTQYRRHPIDQIFLDAGMFLVFPIILGLPPGTWLPVYVLMTTLQALQHAELGWRYGPLYPVVVSPLFHSVHHSVDPDEHHGNYGFMFSVWDHLFGTAVEAHERPARFGVDGIEMPETLVDQFVVPFKNLWRRDDRPGADER